MNVNSFLNERQGPTDLILLTPVITSGSAYASGNQLGNLLTIPKCVRMAYGTTILHTINVLDKAAQSSAITFWFFNASPTIASSDKAALNISDSEMAAKYIGHVAFAPTYESTSANSAGSQDSIGKILKGITQDLYVIAQSKGTPTYGSTSDLLFQFGFLQD